VKYSRIQKSRPSKIQKRSGEWARRVFLEPFWSTAL
jgi:hypothetical protein